MSITAAIDGIDSSASTGTLNDLTRVIARIDWPKQSTIFNNQKGVNMQLNNILVILTAVLLTACGGKEVSFNTLEEAKQMARDNSLFNAQRYRAENPPVRDFTAVSNGDSTQMPDCPQGDGWATLKLFSADGRQSIALKCSTFSGATGCLLDAEFKSKPFASQDGHCQNTTVVPFPLPKIAK